MARIVDSLPDKKAGKPHQWGKYLNGQIWALTMADAPPGTDSLEHVRRNIQFFARRTGRRATTRIADGVLYVQGQ